MNRVSDNFQSRFRKFAVDIIRFCQGNKALPFSVVDQIIRSASSVGANYTEAQNAASKADFRNKIYIAKKESAETEYWLSIINDLTPCENIEVLSEEAHQITMILQKIVNTLREKSAK